METSQQLDFASVYSEHAPYVRRLLVRRGVREADVDDVLQEVFVNVHRQLPGFEGRSRIETWLHAVTWRVLANHYRRTRSLAGLGEGPLPLTGSDDDMDEGARLKAVFGEVDERQRDLIALHDIGELSISELSELTGNARATVRQRLERGRAALGRRVWKALAKSDQDAWLQSLLAGQPPPPTVDGQLLRQPILCDGSIISTLDDLVIVVWRGPASFNAFAQLAGVMAAVLRTSPGFRYLSIVEPTSSAPGREARQLMTWMCGQLGPKATAVAAAVESSRLMTIVAPIMNTSLFLGGISVNLRFFSNVAPAASWLAKVGASDAWQISEHIAAMRKHLDEAGHEQVAAG